MSSVETKRVKFKAGKFKGEIMRIDADKFDPALHEEATSRPKPAAVPPKGRGKGK